MEVGCWERGTGKGWNEWDERGGCRRALGDSPSWFQGGQPAPMLSSAQPPGLGFLDFLVFHNSRKSIGHGAPALKVTTGLSYPPSEPQMLTALPALELCW